jgi:hypothetical protein
VGLKAPFLYKINALYSREYGEPLPDHFPEDWLNIYDLQDLFSYIGAKVFPKKVQMSQWIAKSRFLGRTARTG